ncbi:unnamed protein product [Cylicocyclus nassatus]|uniref:Uncharacterized protein n=1 Tax=Cylicocyclus nassatus TaxID=53992 RepID=A0AA36DMP0_CYLNA|nr:unnamed protein product [Cylicocyclus nassatus]
MYYGAGKERLISLACTCAAYINDHSYQQHLGRKKCSESHEIQFQKLVNENMAKKLLQRQLIRLIRADNFNF